MKIEAPTVGFVSLGCPKNLVDSERILTQLRAEGYNVSASYEGADLVLVNTCGFIDAAVEESLEAIGEALNANGRVIVTGCLGLREDDIRASHPAVLAVTGPHAYKEVMTAVHQHLPPLHDPRSSLLPAQGVKLTPHHYAYLKISEGCNHRCTFCIIPSLRGDLHSRPLPEVVQEAENLVNAGVRELIIISQDTSAYGMDIQFKPDFFKGRPVRTDLAHLAKALVDYPVWIRLLYLYPYPQIDQLIPLMAEGKILPYLDMPLQHANERILKAMKRPAASEKMLDRINSWRELCPELVIRSTFIVGFPGETEEEFEELLEFLEEARLDRVGCFAYSPIDGAVANELPDQIPEAVKEHRVSRLMSLQAEISEEKLAEKIGQTMIVLVDEVNDEYLIARSAADAPDVDGSVIIEGAWELDVGDFVEVKIIGADQYDLWAEPVE
jgi:ribosomal protein S12 methylthiotransferase